MMMPSTSMSVTLHVPKKQHCPHNCNSVCTMPRKQGDKLLGVPTIGRINMAT